MKKLLSIILIITMSSVSYAKCDKDVTYVKEGEKASCDGYLFTPEKEREVRIKVQELTAVSDYSKYQEQLIDNLHKQVNVLEKHNSYLSNRLSQEKDTSFYGSLIYFGLGVAATTLIVNAVDR